MNCPHCNSPLPDQARFCSSCGKSIPAPLPSSTPNQQPAAATPAFVQSQQAGDDPWALETEKNRPTQDALPFVPTQPVPRQHDLESFSPTSYNQNFTPQMGATMLPANNDRAQTFSRSNRRRRNRGGCFLGCLTFLVLLLVIVGASWVFFLRPYVHNLAQNQLDTAMSTAVQQIPPTAALAPAGTIQVQENVIDNLVKLNIAPSDPIQNPVTHITPAGIRMDFQIYGLPNAITLVPQAINGQVVASNVTVEGVAGLVMSPEEMKALFNKHFADAQTHIQRSIQSVQLKDHELDLQLK